VDHRRNKGGNQKFLEFNENENTTYQNLWDIVKAVLREEFTAMSAYIKNRERSQINNLMLHLKLLKKKKEQAKTSRRREMIKIRAKINKIETRKKHIKNQRNKKLVL
jgi:hypothetical protein